MPKPYTFPTLFDEVSTLRVSRLKEWGYLEPNSIYENATVSWSVRGETTNRITLHTNMADPRPYIVLDYKYRDEVRKYKVHFDKIKSNLGKGYVWYFICPQTFKRCRKLYLVGGYFSHREAFKGCMYDSQTMSKNIRGLSKRFIPYYQADKYYSELNSKHFKKYYAGKPTKRYLKLMEKIRIAESVTMEEETSWFLK